MMGSREKPSKWTGKDMAKRSLSALPPWLYIPYIQLLMQDLTDFIHNHSNPNLNHPHNNQNQTGACWDITDKALRIRL